MEGLEQQIEDLKKTMDTEGVPQETKDELEVAIQLLEAMSKTEKHRETNSGSFTIQTKFINKFINKKKIII